MAVEKTMDREGSMGEATAPSDRFMARQDAFIDAATEIMNRDGVQGMTLADVAGRYGLSTPSIRYYFKKKEDLAAACLLRALGRVDDLLLAAERETTAAGRISRFIISYLELLAQIRTGRERPLANFCDVRAFTSQNSEPIIAGYGKMFARLREFFCAANDKDIDLRTASARAFLLNSMVLWVPAWIEQYDVEDYQEVADRIVDIALNGLAATGPEWAPTPISSKSLLGDRKQPPAQESFLVAATQLLNEQGYRGASIDKIAARLDMTKGSFYHYHETKDAFVVECFRRTYDVMANGLRAAGRLQRSGLAKLATVCAAIGRFQLSDEGPLLINSAISALPHSLAAEMLKDWNGVTERFAFLISGGMVDGSIRVIDARVAAQMLNAAVNSTAQLALWTDVDAIEDAARFYLEPLFFGILAAPSKT